MDFDDDDDVMTYMAEEMKWSDTLLPILSIHLM